MSKCVCVCFFFVFCCCFFRGEGLGGGGAICMIEKWKLAFIAKVYLKLSSTLHMKFV